MDALLSIDTFGLSRTKVSRCFRPRTHAEPDDLKKVLPFYEFRILRFGVGECVGDERPSSLERERVRISRVVWNCDAWTL